MQTFFYPLVGRGASYQAISEHRPQDHRCSFQQIWSALKKYISILDYADRILRKLENGSVFDVSNSVPNISRFDILFLYNSL